MKNLKKIFLKYSSIVLLVIVVLSFFWQVFLLGHKPIPGGFITGVYYPWLDYKWGYEVGVPVENPVTSDVVSFTYPMQTFAVNQLKLGQPPIWNPYILSGIPLSANFQSAPFAVTNIAYLLLDTVDGWTVRIIFQHVFAAAGMYIFLRVLKVSKHGAILGGILFTFSGFNTIWSQWNAHVLVASFVPLILSCITLWFVKKQLKYLVILSLSLCFQITSGYPQVVLYTAFIMAIWIVFHILKTKHIVKSVSLLTLYIMIGLGLSSIQLLPASELLSASQRSSEKISYDVAFLPYEKIITFIAPDYYGNQATGNYWGSENYTTNTGFVAVVGMALALIAITNRIRERNVTALSVMSIVGLMLSLPTILSLSLWQSNLFGLQAASAHRALIIWVFSVSALAGFGLDSLQNTKVKWKLPVFIITIIFLYFILELPQDQVINGINAANVAIRNLILPLISLVGVVVAISLRRHVPISITRLALTAVLVLELYWFWNKFTPFSPERLIYPTTPVIEYLQNQPGIFRTTGNNIMPTNFRMAYGIEALEGYDAIYPNLIYYYIQAINDARQIGNVSTSRFALVENTGSHLLSMANVKYLIVKSNELGEYDDQRYNLVFEDKSVAILEDNFALDRAKMYYDWDVYDNEETALRAIASESFPFETRIVLHDEPDIGKSISENINDVEYIKYTATESIISVDTNNDGILYVSDLFYPGWKAYVNGIETPILQANYAFRAIKVPSGKHEIIFRYWPESYNNGIKLTLISFATLVGSYLLLRYTYHDEHVD